jgi:hypothetical protein
MLAKLVLLAILPAEVKVLRLKLFYPLLRKVKVPLTLASIRF